MKNKLWCNVCKEGMSATGEIPQWMADQFKKKHKHVKKGGKHV